MRVANIAGRLRLIVDDKLDAPVPQPAQVFAIGLNYRQHATVATMCGRASLQLLVSPRTLQGLSGRWAKLARQHAAWQMLARYGRAIRPQPGDDADRAPRPVGQPGRTRDSINGLQE